MAVEHGALQAVPMMPYGQPYYNDQRVGQWAASQMTLEPSQPYGISYYPTTHQPYNYRGQRTEISAGTHQCRIQRRHSP